MYIGTIGHVDHGKTTLTAAITRCLQGIGCTIFKAYSDIDNHVEDVFVVLLLMQHILSTNSKTSLFTYRLSRPPAYVKNMLTGAVQMEGAILVVSVMMVYKFKQENM